MRVWIDCLGGLGAVEYSGAVVPGTLEVVRTLNAPSTLQAMLCLVGTGLATPVRRGRVRVETVTGTVLFTGYLTTEPVAEYAGVATEGAVYRLALRAVSDEWTLDRAGGLARAGLAVGVSGGAVGAALAGRTVAGRTVTGGTVTGGAGFVASGAGGGRALGVFAVAPAAAWSVNAGAAAGAGYGAYRVLDGVISTATVGGVTHALSEGDGSLQVSGVRVAAVRELANDVTVSGAMEPGVYWTEVFAGDGTTAAFALTGEPAAVNAGHAVLLQDGFAGALVDGQTWAVADPGAHFSLTGAGFTMSGGNGLDGQTTLAAQDPVELGGTLLFELDGVQLAAGSAGVLGGLYSGVTAQANCLAGFHVRQVAGSTVVVPLVNGVEVGTAYTVVAGHSYCLRLRVHCAEMLRVKQCFYADVASGAGPGVTRAVTLFGGGLVDAGLSVVFELRDLGQSSDTPATVLYDGAVAESAATCAFVAVNSWALVGSVAAVRVRRTGSGWVRTGAGATLLVGSAGQGLDCSLTEKVSFFAGRVPGPGTMVQVGYRGRRRAVARMMDAASVAAEAAGGGPGTLPGTQRWLGAVVRPAARSSEDCEAAAAAVLAFAADRSAAVAGSCAAVNPAADVWPGDAVALADCAPDGSGITAIVRKVTVRDGGCVPERLTYEMAFANDWAEGLGLTLSEAWAKDAVLPVVAIDSTVAESARVLGNPPGLAVTGTTGSGASFALQVDAGTEPPAGGGFEVRRRDGGWGQTGGDLVLRSPVRGFQVPVASVGERFFVRMYDGSSPAVYSRENCGLVTQMPVG